MGYHSNLRGSTDKWRRLVYTTAKWDGSKLHLDCRVSLMTRVPPLGAMRWLAFVEGARRLGRTLLKRPKKPRSLKGAGRTNCGRSACLQLPDVPAPIPV